VQQQVHRAQAGDAVHQFHAKQRAVLQFLLLIAIQLIAIWIREVVVRG